MLDKIIVKTVRQCPFYHRYSDLMSDENGQYYRKWVGWCTHPKLRSTPNCEDNDRKPPPITCALKGRGKLEIDVQREEGEI